MFQRRLFSTTRRRTFFTEPVSLLTQKMKHFQRTRGVRAPHAESSGQIWMKDPKTRLLKCFNGLCVHRASAHWQPDRSSSAARPRPRTPLSTNHVRLPWVTWPKHSQIGFSVTHDSNYGVLLTQTRQTETLPKRQSKKSDILVENTNRIQISYTPYTYNVFTLCCIFSCCRIFIFRLLFV